MGRCALCLGDYIKTVSESVESGKLSGNHLVRVGVNDDDEDKFDFDKVSLDRAWTTTRVPFLQILQLEKNKNGLY